MSIFDFDDEGAAEFERSFRADAPVGIEPLGMFDNFGAAVAGGLGRGAVHLAELAYNVGGLGVAAYETARDHVGMHSRAPGSPQPGDIFRPYQEITRRTTRRMLDSLTPDPETTGAASQIIGSAGEIIAPLLAGAGNPAPLVSGQINSAQDRLERQGVDRMMARRAALIEGAAFALGARAPAALGGGLATRVGSGAAINTAIGAGSRAAEQAVLADYPKIAAQFDPFSAEAIAADAVMGGAFGGLVHLISPRARAALPPDVADADAILRRAEHFERDTAPGEPADVQSEVAHQAAIESKILELMYDAPQPLPTTLQAARFNPTPRPAAAPEIIGPRPEGERRELASVATSSGRRIDTEYALVELDELVTSDRAEYPPELQPRDRGRSAMQVQVARIAASLDPAQLGRSPGADTGAPIVGPDAIVESGNGRVMALRQVYAAGDSRAQAYRDFLDAEGFSTVGMQQPVLVRVRRSELSRADRVSFTEEANVGFAASLSATERGAMDARVLDDDVLSMLDGADYGTRRNAGFVAAFIERLPAAARNEMTTADGKISQAGIRRVQAAVMTRAYGGTDEAAAMLGRALESPTSDVRSIVAGMLEAAPRFAQLRAEIEAGRVPRELDIGEALARAVEAVQRIRGEGGSVAEYLAQRSMLDSDAFDATIKSLVGMFYNGERAASAKKISERLRDYADRALDQRLDQSTMFGDPPASSAQLIDAAKAEVPLLDETDLAPVDDAGTLPPRVAKESAPVAPAPDQFPRIDSVPYVYSGPAGIRTRVIAEDRPLYRETNADGLYDLMQLDDEFRAANTFFSDSPDLAIGQGLNVGIKVTLRPNAAAGRENLKPGTGDIAGREYVVEALAPRAVQAITMPAGTAKQLRGLVKVRLRRFDRVDNADGTVTFNRRMDLPTAREADLAPAAVAVGEELPQYGLTVRQEFGLFSAQNIARVEAIKAAQALVTKPKDRAYSMLGNALAAEFKARGTATLIGKTVSRASDLARLVEVYRDPRFETFRMYFVDANDVVVHQTGVSGRIPGAAALVPDGVDPAAYLMDVTATAKQLGAVKWYASHNHPSGSIDASNADIQVTRRLISEFETWGIAFREHVITDTDKYRVIAVAGDGGLQTYPQRKGADWDIAYDAQGAPVMRHAMLGRQISSASGFAGMVNRHVGDAPVLVGRSASTGNVKFLAEVNPLAMSIPRFRALVRKMARASGSIDVLVGNAKPEHLPHINAARADGWVIDAVTAQGFSIKELAPRGSQKARNVVREDAPAYTSQTETPAFRAWFGESKVVDEQGAPLQVYHGTRVREDTEKVKSMGDITAFDRLFTTQFRPHSIDTLGSWFSTNPGDGGAEMYSGNSPGSAIYPVYLSIKNPHVTTFQLMARRARMLANGVDDGRRVGEAEVKAYRAWLEVTGKDGVKIEGSGNDGSTEFDNQVAYIALHPEQIKSAIGNRGTFDAADPIIVNEQAPAYGRSARADTVARGRIRRTIGDLVTAAESQANWRTWYERHEQTLVDLFGSDADMFQQMLSATSQATNVAGNVSLALKAYGQWMNGEPFAGYLPAVVKNLERVRDQEALEGAKISQYGEANEGNANAIAVDRHIASLLFNTIRPTRAQIASAKVRIGKVAARLEWEPRQVQAALWAYNQVRVGVDPAKVTSYDKVLETRADFIAELRSRHGRGTGDGDAPGSAAAARAAEGFADTEGAALAAADQTPAPYQAAREADLDSPAMQAHAELPEVQAARDAVQQADFEVTTGRLSPDGTPERASAHELMQRAESMLRQSERDAEGFGAAAACAITQG